MGTSQRTGNFTEGKATCRLPQKAPESVEYRLSCIYICNPPPFLSLVFLYNSIRSPSSFLSSLFFSSSPPFNLFAWSCQFYKDVICIVTCYPLEYNTFLYSTVVKMSTFLFASYQSTSFCVYNRA
jgi:hypothetical protein